MHDELAAYLAEEGPRYSVAAATAAHMCNIVAFNHEGCKAELFGRLLFLILGAMYEAEEQINRLEPSDN